MIEDAQNIEPRADALLKLAGDEHARKEFTKAVATLRWALTARPNSTKAWFMLARTLKAAKRWNAARVAFERLSLIGPLETPHRRLYARLLLTLRMHSKAWHVARSLVVQDPADADGWECLARGRALLGRAAEVGRLLGPLNCLRPGDLSVAIAFSRSMIESRELILAETWCRRAIRLGGENAERLLDLARILRAKGDFSASENALNRATTLNPRIMLRARAVRLTVTDADFARPDDF